MFQRKGVEPQSLEALSRKVSDYGRVLYKMIWVQLWLSLLTQVGGLVPFPAYNVAIAMWGLYSIHAKKTEALITFVGLVGLSIILDVTFCGIWGNMQDAMFLHSFDASTSARDVGYQVATSKFCLVMLIFHLFIKVFVMYFSVMYVSASGGTWVLDMLRPDAKKSQGTGPNNTNNKGNTGL